MRISEENKKKIRAGYRKAAKPRAYITQMCEKYGLRRETVRKIIGLRTRDPMLEEAEGKPTVPSWPYDEWAWGGTWRADADDGVYGEAVPAGGSPRPCGATPLVNEGGKGRKSGASPMASEGARGESGAFPTVSEGGKAWRGKKGRVFRVKPSGRPRVFGGEVEQAILADLEQGMATKDAAARHGCSEDTVRRIRRRNAAAQQE